MHVTDNKVNGGMEKYIIGNWKMNGLKADLLEIGRIRDAILRYPDVVSGLCLPTTLLALAAQVHPEISLGGQDCHEALSGAHTGCISAAMLRDVGAIMTCVGHSERRTDQGENDALVQAKARAARAQGLDVIICIGETEAQRDAGLAEQVVLKQLRNSVPRDLGAAGLRVAYEPVWAVGTGRIPSFDNVAAMHAAIRGTLIEMLPDASDMPILYGGSMNGDNAAELLSIDNVGGGLIGGASLTAAKFEPILEAAAQIH